MKLKLFTILFSLLVLGCETQIPDDESPVENQQELVEETAQSEGSPSVTSSTADPTPAPSCACRPVDYTNNYSTDLGFHNSERSRRKNEELFNEWSQDSLAGQIKSINFSEFDTIPSKYAVFSNVERVTIYSRTGIYGLDIFPKLKVVEFFASVVNFDTDENWPSQLKVLTGEKSTFSGMESFRRAPNLQVIHLAYSGFDTFPPDLDQLSCLQELTLGAYRVGVIDLTTLDLSKNACLKKATFQTWYNTLSGLPKGLSKSNLEELKIHHQQLTETEKEELKRIEELLTVNEK
ncbi:MAG: hypothetical protein AAFR36_06980 [Bacteroidota bacterium]